MNLLDIVARALVPQPWSEGDKIPWHDPDFSRRMLQEHLSQAHDAASRRAAKIEAHVRWIHEHVLAARPARILDLGCGPGLYASRLARLGHTCVGIDFSPASIEYARNTAQAEGLSCVYHLADIRQADYGAGFDLAMLIFGELNVFCRADAHRILARMSAALNLGGVLLLEPHTWAAVRQEGQAGVQWYASAGGLFSERPHLCLTECFWHEAQACAVERYWIIDAETGQVTRHAASMQAYTDEEYRLVLTECGLYDIEFYPSLTGETDETQAALLVLCARK